MFHRLTILVFAALCSVLCFGFLPTSRAEAKTSFRLSCPLCFDSPAFVEASAASRRRFVPPGQPIGTRDDWSGNDWGIFALQGFSGLVTGAFGAFVLHTLIDTLFITSQADKSVLEAGGLIKNSVVLLTIPWAVSAVVSMIGNLSQTHEGSYWWALAGAFAGGAVSFGVNLGLERSGMDFVSISVLQFLSNGVLMVAGSMLFYYLFRKQRAGLIRLGSLVQVQDGRLSFGVPIPMLHTTTEGSRLSLPLLQGRF